jgi:Phage integrase family
VDLHQLRHSAATHLGDQKVPLQLIMAKTRHKSPRTVMRYVKPGDEAVAEVTSLLGPSRRTHSTPVGFRLADRSGNPWHAEQAQRHRVYLMTPVLPTPLVGQTHTARVITAAAAIIIAVFITFVFTG